MSESVTDNVLDDVIVAMPLLQLRALNDEHKRLTRTIKDKEATYNEIWQRYCSEAWTSLTEAKDAQWRVQKQRREARKKIASTEACPHRWYALRGLWPSDDGARYRFHCKNCGLMVYVSYNTGQVLRNQRVDARVIKPEEMQTKQHDYW